MKLFICVNNSKFQFGYKMSLIRVGFSIFVASTLLPTIISTPRHNYLNTVEKSNPGISGGSKGLPDDNRQTQEIIHNQHGETANQNAKNDVLNGHLSQEPESLHGETIKTEVSSTLSPEILCPVCNCKRQFHELCAILCCGRQNSNKNVHVNFQQNMTNASTSAVSSATKEAHTKEDHQKNVSHNINSKTESKDTNNEHQEDGNQPVTVFPESEKPPLPSKPATFDSDVSSETSPVSNGASDLFNPWTIIFIFVLSLTLLFSALRFGRQWRRDKLRENYLIDGLYSEARPLCLNDMLD